MRDAAEERARDLCYITDPKEWVMWPYCPMKRTVVERTDRGGEYSRMQCAYLVADGNGPVLHHGNMWAPKADDRIEAYESFSKIIEAGWRVD